MGCRERQLGFLLFAILFPNVRSWLSQSVLPAIRQIAQSPRTVHNVVFTRLSEDCIRALQTAQEQSALLSLPAVDNPTMLLAISENPGRTKSTLDKFDITWDNIRRVLDYLAPTSSTSVPKLSDFSSTTRTELPYSASLQKTLFQAGTISSAMGSPDIKPEHIFLALLEYQEVNGAPQAATRSDDCEAMEIIYHIDATVEGEDICFSLLQAMMEDKEDVRSTPGKGTNSPAATSAVKVPATGGGDKEDTEESILMSCGVDLTQQARDGDLDVVHGRDDEIQACFQTLVRRRKNNVCLIGEAGVGKTSIAEGLAQILVSDKCPATLTGYRIVSLEVAALLAGTKYRGEFEERLRAIVKELTSGDNGPRTILFIDEIHGLVNAGGTESGGASAANILKPYLARGQLQVIGATTIVEYQKCIAKDAALERRFQPVLVKEPTVEQTVGILEAILPFYRSHHRVEYAPESLKAAAKMTDRYIHDRFLPDKAIDIIDEAGALATLTRIPNQPPPVVTERNITDLISKWTGIPIGKLEIGEMDRLKNLEQNLSLRVKGQERAVSTVAKAIRRARTGIRNPRRPIASFLFCGPTGTGKTELCKTLAATYFGSERDMIRIDMSEYMDKSSVNRLTGPPPGFIGYEEGGQLTEAVRRSPHSVVLLDELEKAHGDVLNILLQVMEDGILTDGQGRTVSFKNTVLIMTSNIGSKRVLDLVQNRSNSTDDIQEYSHLASAVLSELSSKMKPEFLNRIDDIVVFQPLSDLELSLIGAMMVVDITIRAKLERNIDITVSRNLLNKMVMEGSKAASQFGARPMRRVMQRHLEDAISDAIVQGFLFGGDAATFDTEENSAGSTPYHVVVSRSRDDKLLYVEVQHSSRDTPLTSPQESGETSEERELEPNGLHSSRSSDS